MEERRRRRDTDGVQEIKERQWRRRRDGGEKEMEEMVEEG